MDAVSFSCKPFDDRHPQTLAITPFVNDVPLTQLIGDFEKARKYEPHGYAGIIPTYFDYGPLDRYFLGECEADSYWVRRGGVYVLGCECGEVGCWPLQCRITTEGNRVTWRDFQQPHRKTRDYSHFGPFIFEGTQYRGALVTLLNQLGDHGGSSS